MSYANSTQAVERAPTPINLTESGVSLNSRLREIRERISRIADSVHGMELKSAEVGKDGPPPTNSIRRNLDVAATLADQIESELSRLENNL